MHSVRVVGIAAVACLYAGLFAIGSQAAFDQGETGVSAGGVAAPGLGGASVEDTGSGLDTGGDSPGSVGRSGATAEAAGPTAAGSTAGSTGGQGAPATTAPAAGGAASSGVGGTITIGVHDDNPGAAFSQFGVRGGPSGDQGQWVRAVVEWINANGGMGGRQVELVHHVTESLNGSFDQQAERACTYFTEDNDVVAVVGGARVPTLNLLDCLARHDTPLVWSYQFLADQATFDTYADHLYMPSMVSAERLRVWMDAVADAGFFEGGTVGVVRYDTPIHARFVSDVVAPALAARGYAVDSEQAFTGATGASSAADLSAQASNAVLRFRSRGVDRVVFVPTAGVMPLLFMAAAQAQGFQPRYTMTSYDSPAFQDANVESFPEQLRDALAFGWTPAGDVDWEQQPQPLSPAAQLCVDITAGAEPTGNGSVRRYCDGLLFLKFLFDSGAEPTTAGIRAAVDALGTSYPSAWTFATDLGPGRHDGAAVGRLLPYDLEGCQCFTFAGDEYPM